MNTDCSKCKTPMPAILKPPGVLGKFTMTITGFRCNVCGHVNDLKRRKKTAKAVNVDK